MKHFLSLFAALIITSAASAQTDSIGVYAVSERGINNITCLKSNQIKGSISGANLVFLNSTSSHHFKGTAVIRVYLGTPDNMQLATYSLFTPDKSERDFGICKFKVKKGARRLRTIANHGFSTTIGAAPAEGLTITTTRKGDVIEYTITGPAGEYCMCPVQYNGLSCYGGVFDFTIE